MKTTNSLIIGALLVCALAACTAGGMNGTTMEPSYPEPTNYVVDAAGAIDNEDALNADLKSFDGTAQIGVAVVDTTYPLTIEQYGIKLAEKWKVGHAGKDNGVIIILAIQDRKVRIEIGKGLEGVMPDSVAGRIVDNEMIPHLKNNDWSNAIAAGVQAIKKQVSK